MADDVGDNIKGEFYEEELNPIEENRYLIERIIRTRKTHLGIQEFLVRWKEWQTKYNSWVKEDDWA